jgi:hypothetical protein
MICCQFGKKVLEPIKAIKLALTEGILITSRPPPSTITIPTPLTRCTTSSSGPLLVAPVKPQQLLTESYS